MVTVPLAKCAPISSPSRRRGGDFVGHEAGGFFQHLLHQFAIGIGKRGQGLQLGGNLQHVVQDELDVGGVGLVVHVVLIAGCA